MPTSQEPSPILIYLLVHADPSFASYHCECRASEFRGVVQLSTAHHQPGQLPNHVLPMSKYVTIVHASVNAHLFPQYHRCINFDHSTEGSRPKYLDPRSARTSPGGFCPLTLHQLPPRSRSSILYAWISVVAWLRCGSDESQEATMEEPVDVVGNQCSSLRLESPPFSKHFLTIRHWTDQYETQLGRNSGCKGGNRLSKTGLLSWS